MNRLGFRTTVVFFALACIVSFAEAQAIQRRIGEVINAPVYKNATWAVFAIDAKTGAPIFALNEDKLMRPASVTKLFSVAAALEALGHDHRFRTPVYRTGPIGPDGELRGDLILVASGDPTLGGRTDSAGKVQFRDGDHTYAGFFDNAEVTDTNPLAGLEELAKQVMESGIRRVTGEIIIDDRLFDRAEGTGSGPAALTPIVVNDNLVDFIVTPGEFGSAAEVKWIPQSSAVQVDAQVLTVATGRPTFVSVTSPSAGRIVVRGQISAGRMPLVRIREVEDPASHARSLFIQTLRLAGVATTASPFGVNPSSRLPASDQVARLDRVAELISPPLSEHAKLILKVSHNLHSGMLPLLLAVKEGRRTLIEGLRAEQRILKQLGVPVESLAFGSAAGGSPADFATAAATVELLRRLAGRPYAEVFSAALPILGVDGTLSESVTPESPALGKVRAKTGTYVIVDPFNGRQLLTSKALAGYLEAKSGRKLIVAMFVNNVAPAPDDDGLSLAVRHGRTLGRLCEILYETL